MTSWPKVVPLDTATHRAVQALLPWHATGTLAREEAQRVEAHLAECPRCQADLQWERGLAAAHRELDTAGDVERGFGALRLQIESRRRRRRMLPTPLQRLLLGWQDAAPWLRGALAVQFALVCALVVALAFPLSRDGFRALGSGAPVAGNLVVKFRPDTPEREMARALAESGARLAGGPTVSGAYVLSVPPGQVGAALARLRTRHWVTLAESLDAAGPAP